VPHDVVVDPEHAADLLDRVRRSIEREQVVDALVLCPIS